jgi:lysophospholipase L1-like esterase
VQSTAPVPVLVVKDPSPQKAGHWVTAPANRAIVVANQQKLNAQIDAVTRQFANVDTVSLAGAGPEDFGWDGLHMSDLGMQYEADLLAEAFRRHVATYRVASMYQ